MCCRGGVGKSTYMLLLGILFFSVVVTAFHFHLKISKHPLPLQETTVSTPVYFKFRRLTKTNSL